jgi:hypothetical protein
MTYRAPSWSWASINSRTENQITTKVLRATDDVTINVLSCPDQRPPATQTRISRVPLELRIYAWTTKTELQNLISQRELKEEQWHLPMGFITLSFDALDHELDTALRVDVLLIEIYWCPDRPQDVAGLRVIE